MGNFTIFLYHPIKIFLFKALTFSRSWVGPKPLKNITTTSSMLRRDSNKTSVCRQQKCLILNHVNWKLDNHICEVSTEYYLLDLWRWTEKKNICLLEFGCLPSFRMVKYQKTIDLALMNCTHFEIFISLTFHLNKEHWEFFRLTVFYEYRILFVW